MDKYSGWTAAVLALLAGMLLGALLIAWWQQKSGLDKRRIPRQWPLKERPLVNSREQRTWGWLVRAFVDQHVMVKIPVTRFTMPQTQEERQHWFELLSGVYCTFTVCTAEGKVLGCIDVPGPAGLSLSNQTLKHTLLSQCNIRYWVVDPDRLPSVIEIRTSLLGDRALRRGELERIRHQTRRMSGSPAYGPVQRDTDKSEVRPAGARAHEPSHADVPDAHDSLLSTGWLQDSFVNPLDSRTSGTH